MHAACVEERSTFLQKIPPIFHSFIQKTPPPFHLLPTGLREPCVAKAAVLIPATFFVLRYDTDLLID